MMMPGTAHFRIFTLLLFGWLLLISGCGGSSGSSGPAVSKPNDDSDVKDIDLSVEITFPLANSSLRGVNEILVRGFLRDDADGALDDGDLASITVNGVDADVDRASGRWSQVVPVMPGQAAIELSILTTDGNGRESSQAITVDNRPRRADYNYLDIEPSGDSLVVAGSGLLRRLDLATLEETVIAEVIAGDGEGRRALLVDPDGARAYVFNGTNVISVDLGTGLTTDHGGFIGFGELPTRYYLDAFEGQFIHTGSGWTSGDEYDDSYTYCGLGVLDMETGESRRVIRHLRYGTNSLGEYERNPCPGTVLLDRRGGRAIVADEPLGNEDEYQGLYAVDLLSGDRTPISGEDVGQGPPLLTPEYMFWRNHGESIVTVSEQGVMEVELASGDRKQLLAEPDLPDDRTDITYDERRNRLLIASGWRSISSLDLASGERKTLTSFSNGVGAGVDLGIGPFLFDGSENRLLIFDRSSVYPYTSRLAELDLNNLQRRVLVSPWYYGYGWSTYLDEDSSILYFFSPLGRESQTAFDLETGLLTVIPEDSEGYHEPSYIYGMCLDEKRGLLYLVTQFDLRPPYFWTSRSFKGVISVDIASGERSYISKLWGSRLLCDPANDRLLILPGTQSERMRNPDVEYGIYAVYFDDRPVQLLVSLEDSLLSRSGSFAWDSVDGRVLLGVGSNYSTSEPTGFLSIDLETGEYESFEGPRFWLYYDPHTQLFFGNSLTDGASLMEIYVEDRQSGARIVIASPD